ncbi:MAG: hypothetical protein QGI45_01440 [Myxococcota bacterium]|nr:hypothetical protein [Myxococcota bacterium]
MQIKEDKEKIFRVLAYGIIAIALFIAVLKSELASLTTDEAWAYNEWISKGLTTIWKDYHLPTNHILHSLFTYFSVLVFGLDEFVLRLPSLLSFLCLLLVFKALLENSIKSMVLRVLCLASFALHPYILDFAALARGYTLMNTFLYGAIALLFNCMQTFEQAQARRKLLLAGVLLGCAFSAIPLSLYLILSVDIVVFGYLFFGRREHYLREMAVFILPQVLVVVAVYFWSFEYLVAGSFFWGEQGILESLNTFGQILFYLPQGQLDFMGYPDFSFASLKPWLSGNFAVLRGEWFYSLPFGLLLLGLFCALIFVALKIIRSESMATRWSSPTVIYVVLWLVSLMGAFVHGEFLGALFLRNRAWLPWFPLFFLMCFHGLDYILSTGFFRAFKSARAVLLFLCLFFNTYWLSSINMEIYWEWPDNSTIKTIAQKFQELPPPQRRLTFVVPYYQHASFLFYREFYGLDWLEPLYKRRDTPIYDFLLINQTNVKEINRKSERKNMDLQYYREILTFPLFNMVLYRHRGLNTLSTN